MKTKANAKATSHHKLRAAFIFPLLRLRYTGQKKKMARFSTAMVIFAAVIALISLSSVESQTSCVSKLVPCYDSLNTTTKPSTACCSSIKEAVEKELSCLCTIYTTPGLLSNFNVSVPQALNLSRRCDVPTDLSACAASGSPSPKASLPPPGRGSQGNDTGAAEKLVSYGFTTVIVSLVSTMFF